MASVFLSHSSHDKDVVEKIAHDLKGVWLDAWNILPGHSIAGEIQRGLERSDFVVLFLSEQAVGSGWVEKEWQSQVSAEAERRDVRIVPARLDDCEIPPLLRDKAYADFRRDYDAGRDALIRAIRGHAEGGLTPPEAPTPPEIPPAYLDWVWRTYSGPDLLGQEIRQGQAITLSQVYVPALTQPAATVRPDGGDLGRVRDEADERPTLLLARLDRTSLFVAAPVGGGKSTFCCWAALQSLPDAPNEHPIRPPEGFEEPLPQSLRERLPLFVALREFARCMDCGHGRRAWRRADLERALTNWVDHAPPDGLNGALVRAHLRTGSAFLLLDGLDEVAVSDLRDGTTVFPRELLLSGLADALPAWEKAGNRVLLTSRPYGLDEAWLARVELERAPLEPLPEPLQELFVRRWFHTLGREQLSGQLLAAMQDRPDLAPLIENPLLLTAVCVLYGNARRLPEDRYDLYKSIVDAVLDNRYPDGGLERMLVLKCLQAIAYGMHAGEPGGAPRQTPAAEISWNETERLLVHFAEQNPAYGRGEIAAAVQREELLTRSGLLLPRPNERAAFYHLSFQEFLAAQRIARGSEKGVREVIDARVAVAEWRPTLLFLFAAQLFHKDPEWGFDLLARLIEGQDRAAVKANPATAVFIAEAFDLCRAKDYQIPEALDERFRRLSLDAIEDEIEMQARQTLGLTLGHLGDPRISNLLDRRAYVEVPAGIYPFGSEGQTSEIRTSFLLSRYPVTNGQFADFVQAGGYANRVWWSENGWEWLQRERWTEPEYWRDRRWNTPNQPVVGVSSYEAEACCAWAGGRLPRVEEWEAAARGPEGHIYPWGDIWEDKICNTMEAGLGISCPVGLFPRSRQAQFGLEDLAGNVWEWCQVQMVKGGYCSNERERATLNMWTTGPEHGERLNILGFRVLRSSSTTN